MYVLRINSLKPTWCSLKEEKPYECPLQITKQKKILMYN